MNKNKKANKAHTSSASERGDASSEKEEDKKGNPIEEFIDPEPSKEDGSEPERTDSMGISKKAKQNPSDESDAAKDKK